MNFLSSSIMSKHKCQTSKLRTTPTEPKNNKHLILAIHTQHMYILSLSLQFNQSHSLTSHSHDMVYMYICLHTRIFIHILCIKLFRILTTSLYSFQDTFVFLLSPNLISAVKQVNHEADIINQITVAMFRVI